MKVGQLAPALHLPERGPKGFNPALPAGLFFVFSYFSLRFVKFVCVTAWTCRTGHATLKPCAAPACAQARKGFSPVFIGWVFCFLA